MTPGAAYPLDAYDAAEIAEQDNRDDARAERIRNGTETSFVVIDLETGGTCAPHEDVDSMLRAHGKEDKLLTYYDPPLQVACVAYDKAFREIEALDLKIKADVGLCSPEALEICHYDMDLWEEEALEPMAVRVLLWEFFARHQRRMISASGREMFLARLVGYNIAAFDIRYLKKLFDWDKPWNIGAATWAGRNTGIIDVMWMCQTYGIMRGKEFKSLRLEDVYLELFGETFKAHDPLADCRATARIAKNIMFSMRQAWEWSYDLRNNEIRRDDI